MMIDLAGWNLRITEPRTGYTHFRGRILSGSWLREEPSLSRTFGDRLLISRHEINISVTILAADLYDLRAMAHDSSFKHLSIWREDVAWPVRPATLQYCSVNEPSLRDGSIVFDMTWVFCVSQLPPEKPKVDWKLHGF
jgi:hypothetical protein